MSLKAKIEAVIYAANEPVTLAQLAQIFADEAVSAAPEAGLPFDTPELELERDKPEEAAASERAASETASAAPSEPVSEVNEQPALSVEDPEAKKQGRQRDREARAAVQKIVDELIAEYSSGDRGMEIREIAGGYRVATKAEYHDAVRSFVKSLKPQMKLSLQALETLAVVAYKQPVTAPEISEIRGVDTSGVLGGLMARKLITTAGRKQVIGRPILYKTTKEFLLRFGLKDISELPSMEEFEKIAADIADSDELSVTETVSEEISATEAVTEDGEAALESEQ